VELDGAVDAKAAAKLRAALEKNLPVLLSLTVGMKDRLARVSADVKASLEGARAVVSSGGGAALRVGACFASSLEAQARAAVQIDVSIEASASASGSIKGGT